MLIRKDTAQPWRGERLAGTNYPENIEALWSDADLAAIGLARAVPFEAPEGRIAVGEARYEPREDGTFAEVYETEPDTTPVKVPKSVVSARIIAAGKNSNGQLYIALALAALQGDPASFARWIASDQPGVNVDAADAIALIQAIGLDPAVILAPDTAT